MRNCFPYACHGGDNHVKLLDDPPLVAYPSGNLCSGCKVTPCLRDASHEYDILCFLYEEGLPDSEDKFNCVIPVLDLLPFGEFWFVVMPRWGKCFFQPQAPTVKGILRTIQSLLKGLAYLHKHRIAHGDISYSNVLINHFGRDSCDPQNPVREYLLQQGQLVYALFDFDLATKFPADWTDEQCCLPYRRSWQGTPFFVPTDTRQGEFDFDPFAFDVGALGLLFSGVYDHLTLQIPMLAPLFDKMLTRDVPRCFTAKQALLFLEDQVYPRMSAAQLELKPAPQPPAREWQRWDGLDPAFLKEWAAYREPPLPLSTKFLRAICEYTWILHTVAFLRKRHHLIRRAIFK